MLEKLVRFSSVHFDDINNSSFATPTPPLRVPRSLKSQALMFAPLEQRFKSMRLMQPKPISKP